MPATTAKAIRIAAQSLLPQVEAILARMIRRAEDADLTGGSRDAGRKADAFESAVRELRAALSAAGGA